MYQIIPRIRRNKPKILNIKYTIANDVGIAERRSECVNYEIFNANFKYNTFHLNFLTNEEILTYQINSQQHRKRNFSTKAIHNNNRNTNRNTNNNVNKTTSSSTCYTKQICAEAILRNLVTQVMPRLCLIIVFMLYLLTTSAVHCADCQQIIMPSMSVFGNVMQTNTHTTTTNDHQFINLIQPPAAHTHIAEKVSVAKGNATAYTAKNSSALKLFTKQHSQFHNNNNNNSNNNNNNNNNRAHDLININNHKHNIKLNYLNISNANLAKNSTATPRTSNPINKYETAHHINSNNFKEEEFKQYLYHHYSDSINSLNWSTPMKGMAKTTDDTTTIQWQSSNNQDDNNKLLNLVMSGLNLQNLPDMNMVNISQEEYSTKYREYLRRVHTRAQAQRLMSQNHNNFDIDTGNNLPFWSIGTNSVHVEKMRAKRELPIEFILSETSSKMTRRHSKNKYDMKTKIRLNFPLIDGVSNLDVDDIEEANIRLMILYSPELALKSQSKNRCVLNRTAQHNTHAKRPKNLLNLKVYQLKKHGKRQWVDGQKMEFKINDYRADDTHSKWIQFDVTNAVKSWLSGHENLGLEVQCDNCQRLGARILIDDETPLGQHKSNNNTEKRLELSPVLNIVGRLGVQRHELRIDNKLITNANGSHHNTLSGYEKKTATRKNKCKSDTQRCCRHSMEVVFKEIKGFEFIIQPKVFDAGYCQGRCPPRYNPANHHALLQGLIWKQNHKQAPRLCCAPSKLVELEVLHVDEKDSQKLKISTWSNMQVIDCACT